MKSRRDLLAPLATAAFLGVIASATAQVYPSRPITMIVPFAAGGPTDAISRIIAERMRQSLAQPIVIENVAGAGGSIGAGRVARAAPDGYTVGMATWSTHVANAVLYQLQYDVLRDFEPVSLVVETPLLLVAKKAMPANDMAELTTWLRANPDKAFQGAAGGTDAVAGFLLQRETGTRFQIVNYRGLAPALQDLLAGQIDLLFDQPAGALPQIRSGSIKVYAVTSKTRLAIAPDIPTADEAGLSGLHIAPWHSLWVPRATPKAIIAKLNAAVVEALADPVVRKRLTDTGQEIPPREQQTPEALAAYHKAETERWWPIIKAAGIKPE
jgi:tripartite-type tricarboxylate transporter receptor subunit TctC